MLTASSVSVITDVLLPGKLKDVIQMDDEMEDAEGEEEENDSKALLQVESDSSSDDDDDEEEVGSGDEGYKTDCSEEEGSDDGDDDEDDDDADADADDAEIGDAEDSNIFEMKKKMFSLVGMTEDDGDVDMDSVPEDKLAELDSQLGALMGEFIKRKNKNRSKKKLAKDETQLMHFRTRLVLFNIFILFGMLSIEFYC